MASLSRGLRVILIQLDQQTLLHRTGSNTDRIEVLNPLEYRLDLIEFHLYVITGDGSLDILQRNGQITGFVDGIDYGERDGGIHIAERCEPHLPQQIILQVFGGLSLIDAIFPIVDGARTLGGAGRVNLVPWYPPATRLASAPRAMASLESSWLASTGASGLVSCASLSSCSSRGLFSSAC